AANGHRQDAVGRDDRILLPARLALDDRAWRNRRTVGCDHFTQGAARHHFPGAELLAVGPALHPRAVGRVDREQDRADEQLAGAGIADGRVDQLELRFLELAPRALDQQDLAVGAFSHKGTSARILRHGARAVASAAESGWNITRTCVTL